MNPNIFSNLIYKHFNYCINKSDFLNDLKHAHIVPVYKEIKNADKKTIHL